MLEIKPYIRKINYHETDKMGVVHHSNFVKFMEEARVDYLSQIGLEYTKFEEDGLVSPVVKIELEYKTPAYFGDTLTLVLVVENYTGTRVTFNYEIQNQKGQLVCRAHSQHCFIYENRICSLQKSFVCYHEMLRQTIE